MSEHLITQDTICALATGLGGGVAIIRISGHNSLALLRNFFVPYSESQCSTGCTLSSSWTPQPRKTYFGSLLINGKEIDEVVTTFFHSPHSYTGQDVVEISCHASLYIVRTLLNAFINTGLCRMAEPGEYTRRAFLSGKMDLVRAESVADLIAAETRQQHEMAMKQLKGHLSTDLNELRARLLNFTALLELELDFSQEDVEFVDRPELIRLADEVYERLSVLVNSFDSGNSIKNGIPVAIVGETNVGKSTLLNTLLGQERAIVSDVHGTTRDTIEDTLTLSGTLFRIIDTAGIRETSDKIEALGIKRSWEKVNEAQIILHLWDATNISRQKILDNPLIRNASSSSVHYYHLLNKIDLLDSERERIELIDLLQSCIGGTTIPISSKHKKGIDKLVDLLVISAQNLIGNTSGLIVSNVRHLDALRSAQEALMRVLDGLKKTSLPVDLLTPDLRQCIDFIGEITGATITTDSVLHHIFSHFCIGK